MSTWDFAVDAVVITVLRAVFILAVVAVLAVCAAILSTALQGGPLLLWPDDDEDWTP